MLLPSFSERFLRRFLVIINSLFIALGGIMIGYGIYQHSLAPDFAEDLDDASSDGTVPIVSGILDVIVGVCGLVGAMLKKRIFLMANAALVSLVLLTNIVLLIAFPIAAFDDITEVKADIKDDMAKNYGAVTPEGLDFTAEIDNYQREEDCCGFAHRDGENIYLSTPWRAINVLLKNGSQTDLPPTLPASCCIKPDATCFLATDVKEARNQGSVYDKDCLDELVSAAKMHIWIKMAQLVATVLMQIPVIVVSVLGILQDSTA